jgi:hypothetical protein
MERSEIRDRQANKTAPDFASLHPGYGPLMICPDGQSSPIFSRGITLRRQAHSRIRVRANCDLPNHFNVIGLSSPLAKNISLSPSGKSNLRLPPSRLTRGAYRDRHGRWVRDAMDALAPQDERRLKRTAKPCGPGAPTLASSWRKQFRRRRWQKSPVTGESTE